MIKVKKEYYNLKQIKKVGANINIIIGQRSNGKSYAVKEEMLLDFIRNGKEFVYLRREIIQAKQNRVAEQFDDIGLSKMIAKETKNEFNAITTYQGKIYLTKYDVEMGLHGKAKDGIVCGYYTSVDCADDIKGSQQYGKVTNILLDEFITTSGSYRVNEIKEFNSIISTVARNRDNIKIYLLANTISRVCPYFDEYGITPMLKSIKEGTIEKIIQTNASGDKRIIAFEYCKSITKNKLFSGSSTESMINNGAWETDLYLKLEKNFRDYENLYSILVDGETFRFMIYLLKDIDTNGYCVYIAPTNKTEHPRTLTTKFSTNMMETNYFLDNANEKLILKLLKTNHCAYANNLTGQDFWNVMSMGKYIKG